ncbi:MAG: TonB-dependent receptor [Planctomycetota bacterium]|nr:TonB-dependent receptor [Planctomycetota bacterium]MDI6788581.1 TonB-dependent receptor [Planctomycetota bacterium]
MSFKGFTWKNLSAFIGVNNLLNKRYEEYGATNAVGTIALYPSPERNYLVVVSLEF